MVVFSLGREKGKFSPISGAEEQNLETGGREGEGRGGGGDDRQTNLPPEETYPEQYAFVGWGIRRMGIFAKLSFHLL